MTAEHSVQQKLTVFNQTELSQGDELSAPCTPRKKVTERLLEITGNKKYPKKARRKANFEGFSGEAAMLACLERTCADKCCCRPAQKGVESLMRLFTRLHSCWLMEVSDENAQIHLDKTTDITACVQLVLIYPSFSNRRERGRFSSDYNLLKNDQIYDVVNVVNERSRP